MLHRPTIEAALKQVKLRLSERFGKRVVGLFVFGSWARGETQEDSDVDLCILLDTLSMSEHRAIIDLVSDVACSSGAPLAPLVWSQYDLDRRLQLEQALAEDIARKGIAV